MTPEEETFNRLKEPAPVIDEHGNKTWFNEKGQTHRENDLPAIIRNTGNKIWVKNGKIHRENGPAVIFPSGAEQYWENGIFKKPIIEED